MLTSTKILLTNAQRDGYAIGAFNVYNLEGVKAVLNAAEESTSMESAVQAMQQVVQEKLVLFGSVGRCKGGAWKE